MESPFVNEARGAEAASGRSYDVVLIPEDDNGAASDGVPDDLYLAIRCQFYDVVPGLGEPLLLHYENESFRLKRPVSAGELSGVTEWLVAAAGAPAAAAADAVRIAGEFYTRFPEARNSMAVIRVTRVNNNLAAGQALLNYVAGGEAELQAALLRSEEESGWERAVPALKAAVEALEKVEIRVLETETSETDSDTDTKKSSSCVVCIQEFSSGDEATKMPCEHVFHGECILKWLEYRPFCPICRFKLPSKD